MSFHVEIDLHDLHVCIVGGGSVAYRKAKQCIQEGAHVTLYAHTICKQLQALPITICSEKYHPNVLDVFDMCFVCTSDDSFNERVLQDARKHHCLCMGVSHTSKQATLHPMVTKEYDQFQMALSTKGNFPAISRDLVQIAGDYIEETQGKRIRMLSQIRLQIQDVLPYALRTSLCRHLTQASKDHLLSCMAMFTCSHIHVVCYHGVASNHVHKDILEFEKEVQSQKENVHVISCFISKQVCEKYNAKEIKIWQLDELMPYLIACKHTITIHPMLLQRGRYFDRIQAYAPYAYITSLPFQNEVNRKKLIQGIQSLVQENTNILVRYHGSESEDFTTRWIRECENYQTITTQHEKQALNIVQIKEYKQVVVFLYMLEGVHMQHDIKVIQAANIQGNCISYIQGCIITQPRMKQLLLTLF